MLDYVLCDPKNKLKHLYIHEFIDKPLLLLLLLYIHIYMYCKYIFDILN
jgi:hypothetical protein